MTQDQQGFDQEPEVPDEATARDGTAESPAPSEAGAESAPAAASAPAQEAGAGEGDAEQGGQEAALTAQLEQSRTALQERTQDLQRLQAEFTNYRRRVDRDRAAVKETATANLLSELLPVLDDIGRARDHGELSGGFKQVAESLETVAAKMGLIQFGTEGEPFDPTIHEALMHSYAPDVTETTCVQILQPGYRIGERTIRPARVGVAEPQPGAPAKETESADSAEDSGTPEQAESTPQKENGGPEDG